MVPPMYSEQADIQRAGSIIKAGGLVVFPTETVYGLGANALSADAVSRIFIAKGRPSDNPLIVHVAGMSDIARVATEVSPVARRLFQEFAPGPLTVVLPARDDLSRVVTAGLDTVAVRMPAHPVAHALLSAAGVPVAAPSANRSGEPSPTTVAMARRSLGDAPDAYLDGGPCDVGLESTVLSLVGSDVVILRPGAITEADILAAVPTATVRAGGDAGGGISGHDERIGGAESPGLRHRHYKPAAAVSLWEIPEQLADLVSRHGGRGELLAVVAPAELQVPVERLIGHAESQIAVRFYHTPQDYARSLYAWFVECDTLGIERILAHLPRPEGMGLALRDRLGRAAAEA